MPVDDGADANGETDSAIIAPGAATGEESLALVNFQHRDTEQTQFIVPLAGATFVDGRHTANESTLNSLLIARFAFTDPSEWREVRTAARDALGGTEPISDVGISGTRPSRASALQKSGRKGQVESVTSPSYTAAPLFFAKATEAAGSGSSQISFSSPKA
ncbi:hypothetical protein CHU98_g6295 [Xylaria longipes]|nr:hypothetical protein CHU98_g6295 [Xylaria longipes]